MFNNLKNRGLGDILIAVVDGLKGLGEAIAATLPQTAVQICIVYLTRNSLDCASWKDRKLVAAPSEAVLRRRWKRFAAGSWGSKYSTITAAWRRVWEHVIPFLLSRPNPQDRLHHQRHSVDPHAPSQDHQDAEHFPSDEAAAELIWRALRNMAAHCGRAAKEWKAAMNKFALLYADRSHARAA